MAQLQAVGSYRYAWRQLADGELFKAESEADAMILKALGRAVDAASDAKSADINALRDQAAAAGIDVDKRRGVARLRSEITATSGSYQRRDMRAED